MLLLCMKVLMIRCVDCQSSPLLDLFLFLKLCVLYSCREDNEILGSYMLIHGVRREDFGQYKCQISNTWFQSVVTSVWLREIGKENSFSEILLRI